MGWEERGGQAWGDWDLGEVNALGRKRVWSLFGGSTQSGYDAASGMILVEEEQALSGIFLSEHRTRRHRPRSQRSADRWAVVGVEKRRRLSGEEEIR